MVFDIDSLIKVVSLWMKSVVINLSSVITVLSVNTGYFVLCGFIKVDSWSDVVRIVVGIFTHSLNSKLNSQQ